MEKWYTERAWDGFVVGPICLPGTFGEFVRLVIPELQRRGVYRKEYAGTTLRGHLGLAPRGRRMATLIRCRWGPTSDLHRGLTG